MEIEHLDQLSSLNKGPKEYFIPAMTLKDHLIECDYYETDVIRNNMDVWLYMCFYAYACGCKKSEKKCYLRNKSITEKKIGKRSRRN